MVCVRGIDEDPTYETVGSRRRQVSRRVNATEVLGSASAFWEMKTRPVLVAAHSVEVSLRSVEPQPPPLQPRCPAPCQSASDADRHPVAAHPVEFAGEFVAMRTELPQGSW